MGPWVEEGIEGVCKGSPLLQKSNVTTARVEDSGLSPKGLKGGSRGFGVRV